MPTEFAPTSAADIVWNQPRVQPPAAAATVAGAFRQQVDHAMAQEQLAAAPAPAAPAPPPRDLVPHPLYEGEFLDARTGRIALPEMPPPVADDPTDGGRLVPHPFYEGEYHDPDAAAVAWFGEDGISVADIVDLVNPLQHIPILSSIYREVTGDTIDPGIRLLAGAALGGPIGFAVAMVNAVVEDGSGQDVGGHMIAMVTGEGEAETTELAALTPAAGPVPAMAATPATAAPATVLAPAPAPQGLPHRAPVLRPQGAAAAGIPPTAPMLAAGPIPAAAPGDTPTPVEALLQARAAVPSAGPVPALGSSRAVRIAAPAQTPDQTQQLAISARLDAHLARLSAMSGEPPQPVAAALRPAQPAPARPAEQAPAPRSAPARIVPPQAPAAALPNTPAPVPTPLVPQAMTEALDKYRAMMRPAPVRPAVRDHST